MIGTGCEIMDAFDKAWRLLKEKKEKPIITWMHPHTTGDSERPYGWVDGRGPFTNIHLQPDYPEGYQQYVSQHEEKGTYPFKNHEIVDGKVVEKDLSGPVPGLPGMTFDAKGNLVGGQ